jgi:hypothetical protein
MRTNVKNAVFAPLPFPAPSIKLEESSNLTGAKIKSSRLRLAVGNMAYRYLDRIIDVGRRLSASPLRRQLNTRWYADCGAPALSALECELYVSHAMLSLSLLSRVYPADVEHSSASAV